MKHDARRKVDARWGGEVDRKVETSWTMRDAVVYVYINNSRRRMRSA